MTSAYRQFVDSGAWLPACLLVAVCLLLAWTYLPERRGKRG